MEVPKQVIRQELAQAIAQIKDLIEKRNGGVAVPAQEVVPVERQVLPDYLTIGGLSSFF
ncbi:hypothetical protein [Nostoc sp.]|uniref:hypothetical protein n=1 Tax=Nostoc sp. TaxID=1180 RepID=UPI002FFA75DD